MTSFGKNLACAAGLTAVIAVAGLAACSPKPETADASASAASESSYISMAASQAASDAVVNSFDVAGYVGTWKGAGGNTLTIVPNGTDYTVTITTTSGTRDFNATINNGALVFTRQTQAFTITKGDGAATGVPELSSKSNCLLVAQGEGYCK